MDNVFLHDLHLVTYTTVQSHRPSVIKITFSGKGSLSYICWIYKLSIVAPLLVDHAKIIYQAKIVSE